MPNHKRYLTVGCAAALALVGGAAAAFAQQESPASTPALPPATIAGTGTEISDSPVQTTPVPSPAGFSVFNVVRTSPVAPDVSTAAVRDPQLQAAFGLTTSGARTVASSSGDAVIVTPGSNGLCVSVGGAGTCNTVEAAQAGQLIGVQLCAPDLPAGQMRVFGAQPDGVTSVTLDAAVPTTIDVANNVYSATVDTSATTVTGQRDGHSTATAIPIPPGVVPCGAAG